MPKIKDEWRTKWPDEVAIPDKIGKDKFYIAGLEPCCAIGHLQLILPRGSAEEKEWRDNYTRAADHVLKINNHGAKFGCSCERINDHYCNEDQRVLLYAVAWGLCGYTEITGFPEATKVLNELLFAKESKA